jgi:hypothetical protein
MKTCAACQKSIPLAEYHKNAHSPDGKRDRCPDCIHAHRARARAEDEPSALGAASAPDATAHGYMYVIQEREFIKTGEPVYKIGMTNQYNPRTRLQHYPSDSCLHVLIRKPDARASENIVKDMLKGRRDMKHRPDIGEEYFEGDPDAIVQVVIIS